jgi:hypothetical protein
MHSVVSNNFFLKINILFNQTIIRTNKRKQNHKKKTKKKLWNQLSNNSILNDETEKKIMKKKYGPTLVNSLTL